MWNTQLKANICNISTFCGLHTGSGAGASFGFHQSHRLSMPFHLLLRRRCCLYDFTRALFCKSWFSICGWFPFSLSFSNGLLACFCHTWRSTKSVDSTIASLTPLFSWLKGAPPGINPSSPPAKKRSCGNIWCLWVIMDIGLTQIPLWQLLRQYPEVAHPQCRDIAPLRLVSWVSCEVPARVQQVVNQLMILFGAVTPVSSNEVLEIGRQQSGVTTSGELSWDMIRGRIDSWGHHRGNTLLKKCVASSSPSCNASHYLALFTSWTWSCFKWSQCSPLATLDGDGLLHLTESKNVVHVVNEGWNIL